MASHRERHITLTDIFGSMYTLKRDFMVGYFFPIAIANRGCTFGIATKAFNLDEETNVRYGYKILADKLHEKQKIKF